MEKEEISGDRIAKKNNIGSSESRISHPENKKREGRKHHIIPEISSLLRFSISSCQDLNCRMGSFGMPQEFARYFRNDFVSELITYGTNNSITTKGGVLVMCEAIVIN